MFPPLPRPGDRVFTCALCRLPFRRVWTEAQALADYRRRHPGARSARAGLVALCQGCYGRVRPARN